MKNYNIGITSKLTGLSDHTLRAWEKRYKIITPKRNDSGHRVYNQGEVDLLKVLNILCNQGHNISFLKNKKLFELKELLEQLGISDVLENTPQIDNNPVIADKSLSNLLLGLESYRLDIVSHEFYNMKMKLSNRDLALNIISPLMKVVGRKVLEGTFSVAQEHAISSIIKFHLGQFMYSGQLERKRNGNLFILSTPEGDYHEFGILLAGLLCAHHNQHFFYLGPNMPAESLIQAALALDADQLILGTVNTNNASNSTVLDKYLGDVLKGIGKSRKLILGGTGFFDFSKVRRKENFDYLQSLDHFDKYLENCAKNCR
ncbi:MAG: DNA-binding transcriptional MerR regulator/methanogenic corrinoid protein MtbC1 [Bacteriovoracaceae bacterium]|jgi:DNA-binding transcriptional MerR regulator/methanogenic corrinoid protein MtbC1